MAEGDDEDANRKSSLAYGAALGLFVSVAIFIGLGWLLDRWLNTAPWLLVGGIVVGAALGFYEFIRIISRLT
jgi:ATP synthase protein I